MYNYVTKYHFYNNRNGKKVDEALDIMSFASYISAMSPLIVNVTYQTNTDTSGYVHIESTNMLDKATINKLDKLITNWLERTEIIEPNRNSYFDFIDGLHLIKQTVANDWIRQA